MNFNIIKETTGKASEYFTNVIELYEKRSGRTEPVEDAINRLIKDAVLKMGKNQFKEAQDLFKKALAIVPSYPNKYHGLSLLYRSVRNDEQAIEQLNKLFDQPKSEDIRSVQVYRQAWNLFLEINKNIAEKSCDKLMAYILDYKKEAEKRTGFAIQILEDNSLEGISAKVEMAWTYKRKEHLIKYRKNSPAVIPHLIAHEIEHILLEDAARKKGCNRHFFTTAETREYARRSISAHIHKFQKQGCADIIINYLCGHLCNCPIDMVIEYNIFQKYDKLRPSQIASLDQMYKGALYDFTNSKKSKNSKIMKLLPPIMYSANITLNCASALFLDYLLNNKSDYAAPYKKLKFFKVGMHLFNIWKKKIDSFIPGDEYEMIDEYAQLLKMQDWYDWQPDITKPSTGERSSNGGIDPEFLKENENAVFSYCLDALKRFDNKSQKEIDIILLELAWLAAKGINHTNPDRTYLLKKMPKEKFLGLHLLCLLYTGVKLIDPDVDTGLDFADAYKKALDVHKSNVH